MKTIALTVLSLSLAAAFSASVTAQNYGPGHDQGHSDNQRSDTARVTRVERVVDQRSDGRGAYDWRGEPYQRQECWNERTSSHESGYYRDQNGRLYKGDSSGSSSKSTRAVIGAIIGGALGNQVGDGRGQTAATIAGAAVGAAVGSNTANKHGYDSRDSRFDGYDRYAGDSGELRCRMVTEYADNRGNGRGYARESFRVSYMYAGQTYQAFTNAHPGRTLRVLVDVRPEIDYVADHH